MPIPKCPKCHKKLKKSEIHVRKLYCNTCVVTWETDEDGNVAGEFLK